MKIIGKIFRILVLFTASWAINVSVNMLTVNQGHQEVIVREYRCKNLSYIESGFPIRDVYVRTTPDNAEDEECGNPLHVEMGNTYIGLWPFLFNWLFYAAVI